MTNHRRPTDETDVAPATAIVTTALAASPLCLRTIIRHRITSQGDVSFSLVCLVPRALIVAAREAEIADESDARTRTNEDAVVSDPDARARAARMRVDSLVREIRAELAGVLDVHQQPLIERAIDQLRGAP